MPNTYSQILIQIVFTVEGRQNLITEEHREDLQKYISGIINNRGQKALAIYCMPDHIHILIGIKPSLSISDMVRDIKTGSSNYINKSQWIRGRFNWQEGFGAFSYARSQLPEVVNYILNQKDNHASRTFKQEYIGMLKKFEVEFDEKYLFEFEE